MSAETERDRFTRLIFYAVVLLAGYLAFVVIRPFLQPLGWAAVFALMLQPVYGRLRRRLKPGTAALAVTLIAAVLLVVPAVGVLSILVREVAGLTTFIQQSGVIGETPARIEQIWQIVRHRAPIALPEDPDRLIVELVQWIGSFLAAHAGSTLQNVARFLFSLVVMLFTLFFFLRDGAAIGGAVRDLLPFDEARRERLVGQTRDLVIASVGAGLTIAAMQGLLGGLTFWLLGFEAPTLWGVAMAFCALLPVLGSSIVWLPAAAWLLLSGDVARGVILLAVGALAIGMVDNVLRPILLSGRTTANGLVIFLGLLGGVAAFGFIGLLLGPVVLVSATTLIEAVSEREPGA